MQMLLIEAATEQEKKIRATVIFRIMQVFSLEWSREGNDIKYIILAPQKEEIEKIINVMNDQFGIRLVCRFEPIPDREGFPYVN
ncbi:hypothetical protein [Brevibacillus brevis]|uniref:DUF4911 domain-containing protein n=1 Tax=Brevibacillus brevis TaxID=1393 RepID=A0ABY9TEQ7_BREBE|nr:hypothetical protein [Brevibacillus brevis]WNC17946.1 hypothetical protein RGB73_30285 [Brevibacillus brevis]